MKNRISNQKNIETYVEKIRMIEGRKVYVSIFSNEGEITGYFQRSYFPDTRINRGMRFNYDSKTGKIEMAEIREPSDEEIVKIRQYISKKLKRIKLEDL